MNRTVSESVDLSIIIPTYGRPDLVTIAALSALRQTLSTGQNFDVHIVDDGGQDGTREALGQLAQEFLDGPSLHYHWIEHAGPAAARNYGVAKSTGAVIAFLDSDTQAQPGWLQAAVGRLQQEPDLFGVEGRVEREQQYPPTPFTEAVENLQGGRWLTCNIFVRRALFLRLGGFDERFTEPCREDSEFAFRAEAASLTLAFVPECVVRHPVREVLPSRQFHHAREGRFEALIERQHPVAYRRHFRLLDGRQVPLYYLPHYISAVLLWFFPLFALTLYGSGVAVILYVWCRHRRLAFLDPFRLVFPALFAPYLRLVWVAWGYWRYPYSPDLRS